jgi:hypothetical protein
MDELEYRELLKDPNVIEGETLRLTAEALQSIDPGLSRKLFSFLASPHLPKPPLRRGASLAVHYKTSLSNHEVEKIVQLLKQVEEAGKEVSGGEATAPS